jgi:predicted phage-related endonuclease
MKVLPKAKHGSAEWLRDRWKDEEGRCVFGASDIPVLMGASPYKKRSELFAEKLAEPVVQEESAVFRRGNILEAPLLAEASHILGREVITPHVIYRRGRLSVSLDGVDNAEQPSLVIEAKTTTRYSVHDSSDLPQEWLWQGWAQQAVTEAPVFFVVLDRDLRISVVELPENSQAIDSLMTEANLFGAWVDEGTPPIDELDSFSAESIARIWQPTPTEIELPFEAVDWVAQLEEARALIKQGEQLESEAKDRIAQMMLNNEIGTFNGSTLVTWKQQAGKRSLDTKSLKAEHPELVAQYEREGNPFRVMRIVKKGNK